MRTNKTGTRVLFTGISGTGVHDSIEKLVTWLRRRDHDAHHFRVEPRMLEIAREREILSASQGLIQMLGLSRPVLRQLWRQAFKDTLTKIATLPQSADIFLSLHACYYHLRTRDFFTAVDERTLSHFKATVVLNLIDDIYDVFSRLSVKGGLFDRSAGLGQGSVVSVRHFSRLFQILQWRSTETLLTDHLIESAFSGRLSARVLAVKHSLDTAEKLIYSPESRLFYLSHPISQPRRMQTAGQQAEADTIINEVTQVADGLRPLGIVFEPTKIDELRFVMLSSQTDPTRAKRIPRLLQRWHFDRAERILWVKPKDEITNPLDVDDTFGTLTDGQLRDILFEGKGKRDLVQHLLTVSDLMDSLFDELKVRIGSRDHRLVEQADFLIVYRPIFAGNVSGGVEKEIEYHRQLVKEGVRPKHTGVFLYTPPEDLAAYRQARVVSTLCDLEWQGYRNGEFKTVVAAAVREAGEIRNLEQATACFELVRDRLKERHIKLGGTDDSALADEVAYQDQQATAKTANAILEIFTREEPPYRNFLQTGDTFECKEIMTPADYVEGIRAHVPTLKSTGIKKRRGS